MRINSNLPSDPGDSIFGALKSSVSVDEFQKRRAA